MAMSFQHNPLVWIVATNSLFWGVPLAVNQVRMTLGNRYEAPIAIAASQQPALSVLDRLVGSRESGTQTALLQPAVGLTDQSVSPLAGQNEKSTATITSPVSPSPKLSGLDASEQPVSSSPTLLTALTQADGLGGPITLKSLSEPAIPAAARAEQLQVLRSGDPLAVLPLHWRSPLRRELGQRTLDHVATVRLPVKSLAERQEVPVVVDDKGQAEGLVVPRDPRVKQAVENWVARQRPAQPGSVQVIVVAAEPLEPETSTLAALPGATQPSSSTPTGP